MIKASTFGSDVDLAKQCLGLVHKIKIRTDGEVAGKGMTVQREGKMFKRCKWEDTDSGNNDYFGML